MNIQATTTTAALANKPFVYLHKEARQARLKAVMKTIVTMRQSGQSEFHINGIKAVILDDPLTIQIMKGEMKETSMDADLNMAIKAMGGLRKVRTESLHAGRGRPSNIYVFDARTLTKSGIKIKHAIEAELAKGAQQAA